MTVLEVSTLLMVAHPPMYHWMISYIHSFVLRIHEVEVEYAPIQGQARMVKIYSNSALLVFVRIISR